MPDMTALLRLKKTARLLPAAAPLFCLARLIA